MRWLSTISDSPTIDEAAERCLEQLLSGLAGERPDLVVVFASQHLADGLERIPDLLGPLCARCVIGCSAGGVIGAGREIEHHPALSITTAVLPGVRLEEFEIESEDLPDPLAGADEWIDALGVDSQPNEGLLVLADPFSFDAEHFLLGLDASFAGLPIIGGLASGGREPGSNRLLLQESVRRTGAIGVSFRGNVQVDTLVAQGCRPIGVPMFVTRAHRNLVQELDGRSPQDIVRELYQGLTRRDQELLQSSLFLGVVMQPSLEQYQHGDFLIRNVLGFDREHGYLAVGAIVQEQQVVQFHLRDAQTSHDDLEVHLRSYCEQRQDQRPSGALLFSCLGRGEHLYGRPDHDSHLTQQHLSGLALGGFFCNGEIGPVQGRSFLHGYTSSFGLFRPKM